MSTPFTHKTTTPRILLCVSICPKTMYDLMFAQGFLRNQSLNIKSKSQIGVCSNKQVLKTQVII